MKTCVVNLPDYAAKENNGVPLEKVGIKNVEVHMRDFNNERVITNQAVYVPLKYKQGVHMSRMVEIVNSTKDMEIDCDDSILLRIADSHNSDTSYWKCSWRSQYTQDTENGFFFDCFLEGVLFNDTPTWYLSFRVPYASVCPCSHEMVKSNGDGIPHMQRATATVTGRIDGEDLSEILTTAVARVAIAVDLIPESLMKRPDELAWCVRAAHTNLFVEDAARVIASTIDDLFIDWSIVCEHEESIHQHNVIAIARKGDTLL